MSSSPPKLSAALNRATADRFSLSYDPVSGRDVWQAPEAPTPALIDEAARARTQLQAFLSTAPTGVKLQWLVQFGVLVGGRLTADEAMGKVKAYERLLAQPPLCFTQATLKDAARKFQRYGFPDFGQLDAFLDEICKPHRDQLSRLGRIAAAIPVSDTRARQGKRYSDMTDAEKAEHDRLLAPIRTGSHWRPDRVPQHSRADTGYMPPKISAAVARAAAHAHAEAGDPLTPTEQALLAADQPHQPQHDEEPGI